MTTIMTTAAQTAVRVTFGDTSTQVLSQGNPVDIGLISLAAGSVTFPTFNNYLGIAGVTANTTGNSTPPTNTGGASNPIIDMKNTDQNNIQLALTAIMNAIKAVNDGIINNLPN